MELSNSYKFNRISATMTYAVALGLATLVGCEQTPVIPTTPTADNGVTVPGGTATSETGPIVRFTSPNGTTSVRDDQVASLEFSVDTATDATVALFLDTDADNENGNEIDLAAGLVFPTGVTSASQDLIAGFFPYGAYIVKARATDGTRTNFFSAPGIVNVVPGGGGAGTDEGLGGLTGLQLLHDSGKPQAINQRVPFIDTWHVIDVADNLAPRMVVPIEFNQDVELHRLQFYVFGMDEPRSKRLEIYSGTDENTVGERILQLDVQNHDSRRNGWWNNVALPEPLALPAGKYGVSYHAALEFSEHWAGNAPNGPGFVWVSPVQTAVFSRGGAAEFGFSPNFGMRVIGKFTGKGAASARVILPDRRAEVAEVALAEHETGDFIEDPTVYRYDRDKLKDMRGFHVLWRRASAIDR